MSRREFTAETKRQAWDRAGGRCEGEGPMHGLPEGVRCNRDLILGVHYDHDDPDANSKDNSLGNCKCLCPPCHRFKTSNRDRPLIAKTDHQQDKHRSIEQPYKRKIPNRVNSWGRGVDNSRQLHADEVPDA